MAIEMIQVPPPQGDNFTFEMVNTLEEFFDCMHLVLLPFADLPTFKGVAFTNDQGEQSGFVPLEIGIDDLASRASALGFRAVGYFAQEMPEREGPIYQFFRGGEDSTEVSKFSVHTFDGKLWVTNSACRKFFETFMGGLPHFYRREGAVG